MILCVGLSLRFCLSVSLSVWVHVDVLYFKLMELRELQTQLSVATDNDTTIT